MKTSFYFLFWFIVYYLIGLTGNQLLIQNDLFVALILVFFISRFDSKLFHKETQYQANKIRQKAYRKCLVRKNVESDGQHFSGLDSLHIQESQMMLVEKHHALKKILEHDETFKI